MTPICTLRPIVTADQAAAPHAGPDAALLGLCLELAECGARISHFSLHDASDDAWNAALDRWYDLVKKITYTPARTPDGIRAKAIAARLVLKENVLGGMGKPVEIQGHAEQEDLLGWSLVHDVLAEEAQWS
jgi:hypothetical protein